MTPTRPPSARGFKIDPTVWAVGVAAIVPFLPALNNGLVWDDGLYVTGNPLFGLAAPAAVAHAFLNTFLGNWHPLTMLDLAADNAIGGPGPLVFHSANLLLHAINASLVYLVLRGLTGHRGAACCGSLLWAVHPLRVESVAWISERKDLLYVCCFLLALLAFLRHSERDERPGRSYLAALLLFAAATLAKAMAVSLVPVLFLADRLLGRRVTRGTVTEKVPFILLGAAVGGIAIVAQRAAGAIPQDSSFGLPSRIAYACFALSFYLVKTLVPTRLSGMYRYPAQGPGGLPAVVWGGVAAAVLLATIAIAAGRRSRAVAFGSGFTLATVALVLQVLPVGDAVAADRYTYLPAVGLSFLLAAALARADQATDSRRPWRIAAATVVFVLAVALGTATWIRCGVWRDDFTFWSDVVSKDDAVTIAHQNLGVALDDRGDGAGALREYGAAIRLNPRFAQSRWSRGNVRAAQGDLPGALADYSEAIRLDPTDPKFRFNQGLTLGDAGRWDEALEALGEAIRLKPDFAEAYLNRGLALEQMGRAADGLTDVLRAAELGSPVDPAILARFASARDRAPRSN